MPEFDEGISESLDVEDSITMEVLGFVPIFGSVEGADRYFSERLDGQLWDTTTLENKTKALITATRAINNLRFVGCRTSVTQPLEWPRNCATLIPEIVQQATYEEAFALLSGIDPVTEAGGLNVISRDFGRQLRTDYDVTHAPEHVVAGIASFKAWQMLRPCLLPSRGLFLRRGN